MSSTSGDPLVVTVHAVYALTGLGKYKFLNSILANLAFEAVGMIGIVTGHDSFVQDRFVADIAAIGAACANWRAVRKQKQIRIRRHLVAALGASETVDVKEGLSGKKSRM